MVQLESRLPNTHLHLMPSSPTTDTRTPFVCLQLTSQPIDSIQPMAAVESATRWKVERAPTYELNTRYRTKVTTSTNDTLHSGFRWYSKEGHLISESTTQVALDIVAGSGPGGLLVTTANPPPGSAWVSIIFEMRPGSSPTAGTKVRIEGVELYRRETGHDTGWEYTQVPNATGITPDDRPTAKDDCDANPTITFADVTTPWNLCGSIPR